MVNKSIILLSGGLDSLVSLAICKEKLNIEFAIIFNYGQKSYEREYKAAKSISEFYNIKLEKIDLNWLKNISNSSLNTKETIPLLSKELLDKIEITQKSSNSVWVPNRNALFINIAACFADAQNYSHIIIGANKEEGATFKDNNIQFINSINNSLKNSTNNLVKVEAPLINLNKAEIVKLGLMQNSPFKLLHSCYLNKEKHCGQCESCLRLKRALELNNCYDIISEIFE